ncbi:hypothetical protein [Stigmatella erecta]|uniref:Uncharacterized protein n=1 Tax=Stigmatella erecta TaxID=83460 RepID=A0A1I0CEU0_9BACT|nr:hypothetical protein [Stigmatella erecta]SET18092.1 hypothetical protein SAMN05443639_10292 [Stigmatella erecta]
MSWTLDALAGSVIDVMRGVLVHQRHRWPALEGHQRQYENWWKGEFALALESWSWTEDLPAEVCVIEEAKPRDYGITGMLSAQAMDLLVAPWRDEAIVKDKGPRVWIEIKTRAWWWGPASKAFGSVNGGLAHDLTKWSELQWGSDDIGIAAQLVINEGAKGEFFPPGWEKALDAFAKDSPRWDRKRATMSFPLGDARFRYATLEFFCLTGR